MILRGVPSPLLWHEQTSSVLVCVLNIVYTPNCPQKQHIHLQTQYIVPYVSRRPERHALLRLHMKGAKCCTELEKLARFWRYMRAFSPEKVELDLVKGGNVTIYNVQTESGPSSDERVEQQDLCTTAHVFPCYHQNTPEYKSYRNCGYFFFSLVRSGDAKNPLLPENAMHTARVQRHV